ncbi:MAG TPA: asparagine synthetase B family protein [Candidatus Acidoferrales bacterium]|nr:asparagine synthetase B family protein [Candidatus Acidoferrales bacterium]
MPARDAANSERADEPYFCGRCDAGHLTVDGASRYIRGGSRPEGLFAEWNWDGVRLIARTDRYGLYPLFYFAKGNEIWISPSLLQLLRLGAPPEFDDAAIAVFLRLGFFLANDTPFKFIRALPPGALLEWDGGAHRLSGGFFTPKPQNLGREQAVEGYIDLFKAAIRRRLPADDNFAVPLSGGRDSRHILLELVAAGRKPRICPTVKHFPPRSNSDVEVASRLTSTLKLNHAILAQPASRFRAELRKNLETDFGSDELAFLCPLADHLTGKVNTTYDGLAGDILSAGHLQDQSQLALFRAESWGELAALLLSNRAFLLPEAVLAGLLAPEFYARFGRDLAIAHLAGELGKHSAAANPAASFFFWNRTRREIGLAPARIFSKIPEVHCPYLDYELCDFLLSLPAELTIDHQFHTEAIHRAHPAFREVPFAQVQHVVDDRWHHRRLALEMAAYTARAQPRAIQKRYLFSRLSRRLLDGSFQKFRWLQPSRLIWLVQLEALLEGR